MKNALDLKLPDRRFEIWSVLLLVVIVSPHIANVNAPVLLTFVIMMVWKIAAQWQKWMANRWLIVLFALISFSISAWLYGAPLGRDPGVSFLIILIGLKTLESRTRRDLRIVLVLGYFVVITHFLYFTNLPVVLFLFAMVFTLTWFMLQLGHSNLSRFHFGDIRLTAKMIVQAIPFALLLFFLFPRFAGSLWLIESSSDQAVTGMSDTLTMGAIAELVGSDEIAFTATFPKQTIPPGRPHYWRGGVLWNNHGNSWIRGESTGPFRFDIKVLGETYDYEVEIEPSNKNWLFALDIPVRQTPGAELSAEMYLYKKDISNSALIYSVTSANRYINKNMNAEQQKRGVQLDAGTVTLRMRRFVNELVVASKVNNELDPRQYANKILTHFFQNPFVYSLQPPLLNSNTPVDEFLFTTKTGFCEHYATTFTTLMRAANIPARVVIGYLGGEHNPLTNQIVVRQSDAHAWSEFWSDQQGWVRVDPTAAIAPERIENAINYDLSIGDDGKVVFRLGDYGFLRELLRETQWYSALVKQQWNKWFVRFDHSQQQSLLENMGLKQLGIKALAIHAFLIGLLILVGSAFLFYKSDKNKPDKVSTLYARYCKKLETAGLVRNSSEGPMDFYERCKLQIPDLQNTLYEITNDYTALRYGSRQIPDQLARFENQIRVLTIS